MRRKKILFLISAHSHGRGGHYHSLNHVSNVLSKYVETRILMLGTGRSHVIENNKAFLNQVNTKEKGFFKTRREVKQIIKTYQPDIIHCFDSFVFELIKIILYPQKTRIVVNKCGGPNPRSFSETSHLVLFSEENLEWFRAKEKFKNSSIYLIPNRINREGVITESNKSLLKDANKFTFLRICRIGKSYESTISASIELISELCEKGIQDIKLYIIGTIERQDIYEKLKVQAKDLPVVFLTEDQYTQKASNMLYLADAVVGTGRGLMEATALGKPVLTPAKNSNIPILINNENFSHFFKTNFSTRAIATDEMMDDNFENIINMISEKEVYEEKSKESSIIFKNYFDVEEGGNKYLEVYKDIMKQKYRYKISDNLRTKSDILRFFFA